MKAGFIYVSQLLLFLFAMTSCEDETLYSFASEGFDQIIPLPNQIVEGEESFRLNEKVGIISVDESLANEIQEQIVNQFGFSIRHKKSKRNIELLLDTELELPAESYQIFITENHIQLKAGDQPGLFYATQSFLQMLEKNDTIRGPIEIPGVEITDVPRYSYRGSMLDVSRHFFTVDEVKTYIDWLARYKMNTLHLHLTDDQGWRIEIKNWPNLTEFGGSKEVGGTPGGYYTQEDYSEIVSYAASKHITVIPEIDMPGHTNSALASYPELNCDGKATTLYTGMRVGFSSLCIDKEITYEFLEDVISQLSALTPGPYFHIGGDEAMATKESDYKKFIEKVESMVNQHGKVMMGWNDITKAQLDSKTVAQYWHDFPKSVDLGSLENPVILSPAPHAYLDMKYTKDSKVGLTWAGLTEVDKAYNWDPATYNPSLPQENIIGVECPLWTETATNIDELAYLALPRLIGHAEIGWTNQENRNWEDYKDRLAEQSSYLKKNNINYYPSPLIDWE